jgi:cell wall-associated NlpC family hydrolase
VASRVATLAESALDRGQTCNHAAMRTSISCCAVGAALLLAATASAAGPADQYTDPLMGESPSQGSGAAGQTQQPAPADGPSSTVPEPQAPAAAQAETEPDQTDTQETEPPSQQDTTTEEEPDLNPEEVPNQYRDPLAGQGGGQEGQSQQQSTGTVTPTTSSGSSSAGGELASTGFAIGLLVLAGSALLGGGVPIRRRTRDG